MSNAIEEALREAAECYGPTMSIEQAMQFAQVSRRSINRWAEEGRLAIGKAGAGRSARAVVVTSSLVKLLAGSSVAA